MCCRTHHGCTYTSQTEMANGYNAFLGCNLKKTLHAFWNVFLHHESRVRHCIRFVVRISRSSGVIPPMHISLVLITAFPQCGKINRS